MSIMRLDLTEHWAFTQHPSYFETENSVMKIFLHCPKGDPNCWFCRGSAQDCFKIWGVVGGTYPPGWTILSLNTQSDLVMPLTGYLWPKLGCCTKSFPILGPNFDKARFLVKCGLIWLNMGINSAWFVWTLPINTASLTFRDWEQCHE